MGGVRDQFELCKEHWEQIRKHVMDADPEEACGLVAGKEGMSVGVFPVENALHSSVRYRMDPEGQLTAMLEIEEKGWEIAAIYHSHTGGPEGPSNTDIEGAAYPGVIHMIWFPANDEWTCRGYLIEEKKVSEVEIRLILSSNSFSK
jgi:[CysO sulfur-carrier protein]-S-L-cysteine hydrolase